MAENSAIEWCHNTFNPWEGCEKDSAGCKNCYAETRAKRYSLVTWGSRESGGTRRVKAEGGWKEPVKWNRQAEAALEEWAEHSHAGNPAPARPRVFCLSLGDVFEDWQGPMMDNDGDDLYFCPGCKGWGTLPVIKAAALATMETCPDCRTQRRPLTMPDVRARLFDLIDATPYLDWLLLTKRPQNILRLTPPYSWHPCVTGDCPHDSVEQCDAPALQAFRTNVWMGATAENQKEFDRRVPELLKVPAAVHFLSCEPLLESINAAAFLHGPNPLKRWVIAGGESGRDSDCKGSARPMPVAAVRSLRDQCEATCVPFFFKQWGDPDRIGTATAGNPLKAAGFNHMERKGGRGLDGRTHDEYPTPAPTPN